MIFLSILGIAWKLRNLWVDRIESTPAAVHGVSFGTYDILRPTQGPLACRDPG